MAHDETWWTYSSTVLSHDVFVNTRLTWAGEEAFMSLSRCQATKREIYLVQSDVSSGSAGAALQIHGMANLDERSFPATQHLPPVGTPFGNELPLPKPQITTKAPPCNYSLLHL